MTPDEQTVTTYRFVYSPALESAGYDLTNSYESCMRSLESVATEHGREVQTAGLSRGRLAQVDFTAEGCHASVAWVEKCE